MVSKTAPDAANRAVARNPNWKTQESIDAALDQTKGKVKTAARFLGVSEAALRHRITELKLGAGVNNGNGHADAIAVGTFRSPLYDITILKPENWQEKRPCWYCGMMFAPLRKNNWDQHFCEDEHRQIFNKWGYLPFEKLMIAVQTEIRRQIQGLILESLGEATISKVQPALVKMIRDGETGMREYVRKTVASMLENPERVRKELAGAESST